VSPSFPERADQGRYGGNDLLSLFPCLLWGSGVLQQSLLASCFLRSFKNELIVSIVAHPW
jgi:hypothetical protein